jgi:cytochrome c biogenesis protein CcmG/thiol:disulfide interchange protein DsbE
MTKQETPDFLQAPAPPPQRATLRPLPLAIIALLVLSIILLTVQLARQNQIQPQSGQFAPDFTVTTFEGDNLSLANLRGQVVIVNFWASWCAPCRAEAPDLQAIYEDYGENGVIVVGVNWLDVEREAQAFMQEFGLTYPNAPDIGERIGNAYNIQGAPENFIIGRDGTVVEHYIGAVDYGLLANRLDALLAEDIQQG